MAPNSSARLVTRITGAAVLARLDAAFEAARAWLDKLPAPRFVAVTIVATIGTSLFVLAPRLSVLAVPMPGSFEWDRATNYLIQCSDPLATNVEPALRWRLLPPSVANALQLPGFLPLVIPWLGLVWLVAHLALVLQRVCRDRLAVLLAAVLFGTTGAVSCITMAHGINDAWFLTGLLAVATSPKLLHVTAACLLAPWVDERFLLGLPIAYFCRKYLVPASPAAGLAAIAAGGAAIAAYAVVRMAVTISYGDPTSAGFLRAALSIVPVYLPFAHLGWWMGLRAAWVLPALFAWWIYVQHGREAFQQGLLAWLVSFGAIALLAADLTRSTNIMLPLFVAGAGAAVQLIGSRRTAWLLAALLACNLFTPYVMVTYNKTLPLHSLPFEIVRLIKNPR